MRSNYGGLNLENSATIGGDMMSPVMSLAVFDLKPTSPNHKGRKMGLGFPEIYRDLSLLCGPLRCG
jgi:hypothetical protein